MENKIQYYLDKAIDYWRERKIQAITEEEKLCCSCYVDAFQSVRVSILGKLKK